jgi:hypothetical protein
MSSHLNPPGTLTTQERSKFIEVVGSVDPRHFQKSDIPQIVSYIRVILVGESLAAKATRDPDKDTIASWDRMIRQQTALARTLRLTVQSRVDPKTAGRRATGSGRPLTYSDFVGLQNSGRHARGHPPFYDDDVDNSDAEADTSAPWERT